MTIAFRKGRYESGFAETEAEMVACQALRHRAFFGIDGIDADRFDAGAAHLMVRDVTTGTLVATARLLRMTNGASIHRSYAAQYYDLQGLMGLDAPMIEVGRFCTAPEVGGEVLRVAWGALAQLVEAEKTALLFGCTSFVGNDPTAFTQAFDLLAARHLGPAGLRPGRKAAETLLLAGKGCDPRVAIRQMPQMLKTYLSMGGWVSDHAVIDRKMGTIHVFTALEVAEVPPARAKALRALAGPA